VDATTLATDRDGSLPADAHADPVVMAGDLCVVTGGAGFIGSALSRALLDRGMRVRVFDDLSSGARANLSDDARPPGHHAEIVEGDLRDASAVARAVAGASVVFHQGAIPSIARSIVDPSASHDVNVTGTLNVLLAARDADVERVVYASSASVYGNAAVLPLHEALPTRPVSPYGVTKLAGERYCEAFTRTWQLRTISLRYLNVFGPRQGHRSAYASAIPRFIACTLSGEPPIIFGDGEQTRDFVCVDDVVHANLLAAEAPAAAWGGSFNIGSGTPRTVNEVLEEIRRLVPGDHPSPNRAEQRRGEMRHSWSDIALARDVLGYEPQQDFSASLRRTIAWFESAGEPGNRSSP
jgi:nucleoside-diphosphate-sugar epimerase